MKEFRQVWKVWCDLNDFQSNSSNIGHVSRHFDWCILRAGFSRDVVVHWWRRLDVVILRAASAAGRQQEQHARDDWEHVADHSHPEAPAEVRRADGVFWRMERLTEVLAVLRRVSDNLVRVIFTARTERCQCS